MRKRKHYIEKENESGEKEQVEEVKTEKKRYCREEERREKRTKEKMKDENSVRGRKILQWERDTGRKVE